MSGDIEREKAAIWEQHEATALPPINYNLNKYGEFVDGYVKSCADSEKRWLCNRIAKIHAKGWKRRKNHRLCAANSTGGPNKRYVAKKANNAVGRHDVKLTNPQTGNVFWYGFNHAN